MTARRRGEPQEAGPPPTEVEEPVAPRPAAHTEADVPETDVAPGDHDISGVDNFIEEGGPLEPSNLLDD